MVVVLRQRTIGKKISLYLDYYKGGLRKYEFLKLYLHKVPKDGKLTKEQKLENEYALTIAEQIRVNRFFEMQSRKYGFFDPGKMKANFLDYVKEKVTKRFDEDLDFEAWKGAYKQLRKFCPGGICFEDINSRWLEEFKEYLLNIARSKVGKRLSINTQASYFNKICLALKTAQKEGIIPQNPSVGIKRIRLEEVERAFLSYEELRILNKTDCEELLLKDAFLFSALTGLRWSDIQKLKWSEVQHSEALGYHLRFTQKKTKGLEMLPISAHAFTLLGNRKDQEELVFRNLKYSAWNNLKLQQWVMKAGIQKKITFHCARHTYATLQLTLGTDIYTVSKLLGHRNLKTTQVYARVIDQKKIEAANKIML